MKRTTHILMLLAAAIVIPVILIASPPANQGARLYQLDEQSNYQEGCFAPCECPIMIDSTLHGTFLVVPAGSDGSTSIFDIADVNWHFHGTSQDIAVTGGGLYALGLRQQRLQLDLKVDEQPVQHFDSGLVPVTVEFPAISVDVSLNGFYCYDHVFAIVAHPSTAEVQGETWGALKSTYR